MNYLQIFADKEALLEPFDDAERGRLLTAMLAYALHDQLIELTGNERYIWPVFRQMIDQSRKSLQNKQAGGKARAESACDQHASADASMSQQTPSRRQQEPADIQQEPAEAPINQESGIKNQESVTKSEGERARATARFTPPTPDEVRSYAAEKGLTVDADRFCDFYASKGWRVGSQPMRDWKAAVRGWCARDRHDVDHPNARCQTLKTVLEQQYTQREYKDDDSLPAWMMERLAEGQAKKGASP